MSASSERPRDSPGRWAFVLAVVATSTAISMSVLAGWQRGDLLPEKFVWVAVGVVLVVCAHLLPALCRSSPAAVRGVAMALWLFCMAAACYGHALFFLMAQEHAGERRADSVSPSLPVVSRSPVPSGRSLTAIMEERAKIVTALAATNASHCSHNCTALRLQRVALSARLDALEAEAGDVRRQEAIEDDVHQALLRDSARREAMTVDPVTSRLATLLGTTVSRVELVSGLAFAAVLEGTACLLWSLALRSGSRKESHANSHDSHEEDPVRDSPSVNPVTPLPEPSRRASRKSRAKSPRCTT